MTHDELLAKHKKFRMGDLYVCDECTDYTTMNFDDLVFYPCPTIQVIEKESM